MATEIETRDGQKRFKWTLEIEVAECWVADGFNPQNGGPSSLVGFTSLYRFAATTEFQFRVVDAPDPKEIRKTQGYEDQPSTT